VVRFVLLAALALGAGRAHAEEASAPGRTGTAPSAPPPTALARKAPPGPSQAAAGTEAKPSKAVEEPVFQLPELVIVGENQARILAQKEQMADTPMKVLREAPLLEKEEGAVAALRLRDPAPFGRTPTKGPFGLVKAQGGSPTFLGGDILYGTQGRNGFIAVRGQGDSLKGPAVAAGRAGGWNAGISVLGAYDRSEPDAGAPGLARSLSSLTPYATGSFALGWREAGRNLPAISAGARRRADSGFMSWEGATGGNRFADSGKLEYLKVSAEGESRDGFLVTERMKVAAWDGEALSLGARPRVELEYADKSGNHFLMGSDFLAAWVPGERLRATAGMNAEGVFAGGIFLGSVRPLGGVSWTTPAGPTVSAVFEPHISAPWMVKEARECPYSWFEARMVPERELADFTLSAWQERWDGSEVRAAFRLRESRDALAWYEFPGSGVYHEAALDELRVSEFSLGVRWHGFRNLGLYGTATFRAVSTEGGKATGLPKGEGLAGAEYRWRALTGNLEASAAGKRARSIAGGELAPYFDLAMRLGWRPVPEAELFAKVANLLGDDIEIWGGYPEPRGMLTFGAVVAF
jgi:hypothetical protein